jgi:hypothetical protein
VDLGKVGDKEVDFVAHNEHELKYYQVAWTVNDSRKTLDRECRPFDMIPDHYEKILLTMDRDPYDSVNGVKKVNVIDFLLGGA